LPIRNSSDKMTKNSKILIGLLAIVLIGGLAYYFKTKQPITTEKQTVKIGMVTFPGYAPLYLAKEKGYFKDINVELVRIEAVGDLRAAMLSGKIDMYLATPDIFQATEQQEPVGVGFLAIDESHGADGVAVSENIKTVSDLKGKKVGAEPGFPPYFVLQYMLHKENLTLKDLDFKDIASQDAGNAFVAKQLDAVGTYEPYLSKSVSLRPNSRVLVSSADLSGLIVDLIYANEKLVNEKPEVLKKIADGWFEAVAYYEAHKDESMQIMSKAFGVTPQEMVDIKSGVSWLNQAENKKLFDKNAESNIFKTFDLVGEILLSNNANTFKVSSKNKLTDKIIQQYTNQ
jgi:NitT/TauT family transport system substrate-binding protein